MNFEVTILGCGAATPTGRYNPSAQIVNVHDKLFLVDCGEGTQMQIRKYKIRLQRIQHIFISHLHGDHYLGLMGLLSTLHLLGRNTELHVYGPSELKALIDLNLKVSQTWLVYPLHVHVLTPEVMEQIVEDKTMEVHSFPLKHRIATWGFVFKEKERPCKMRQEMVERLRLSPEEITRLKSGESITREDGQEIAPESTCEPAPPLRSYAYCSDTAVWEPLTEYIPGVDLLYHESTFLNREKTRAAETFHCTAEQAAEMAKKLNVGQLILGHFSARYDDMDKFTEEARPIFPNSVLAEEGKTYAVVAK